MQNRRIGVAGCGALGSIIVAALERGIPGYELVGIAEIKPVKTSVPIMTFDELAAAADCIVEALPPDVVPELARAVLPQEKELLLLSAAALLRFPEIIAMAAPGQLFITAGALGGIDAVRGLALRGLKSAKLISSKAPGSFAGTPYVIEHKIDVGNITSRQRIFAGTAAEAARGFPANTNVGTTLAIACTAPGASLFGIDVEIWADPDARGNTHKIIVEANDGAVLTSEIFSPPSAENPKSSPQAAYSMIAHLQGGGGAFRVK